MIKNTNIFDDNDSLDKETNLSEENSYNETLEVEISENIDKSLTIIGIEHNSQKSVEEVKEAIYNQKPDVVAIELDDDRYNYLIGNESNLQNKVNDLVDLFNNFILGYLDNNTEMKAAIDVAKNIGLK